MTLCDAQPKIRGIWLAAIAVFAAVGIGVSGLIFAQAQDRTGTKSAAVPAPKAGARVGEKIGDWTFQCLAVSATQNVCALTQVLGNPKTNRRILALTMRPAGKDNKLLFLAQAPLGVFLPAGLVGKIDDREQFNFSWQRCTRQGCQAAAAISDARKAALMSGKNLLLGFKIQPAAKTIALTASLKGITQGLMELGVK